MSTPAASASSTRLVRLDRSASGVTSNPLRAGVTVPVWVVALAVIALLVQGSFSPLGALNSSHRHLSSSSSALAEEDDLREGGPWRPSVPSAGGGGGAPSPPNGDLVSNLWDETNVPVPRRTDGSPMSFEERLRYLELKSNSQSNFGSRDPAFGSKVQRDAACPAGKLSGWEGYRPKNCGGSFDHKVCLDGLPEPREWDIESDHPKADGGDSPSASQRTAPCLVYDFGVREQPQFGAVMARTFGCEVHAFDPSPVSIKWWQRRDADKLRALPNYHFHPYGAGGIDGDLTLMEYDWGQVSIIRYPSYVVDCGDTLEGQAPCDTPRATDKQKSFTLPVKTLPTIMRELGHENRTITVLKVDVEGSEYAFLENALDRWGGGLPRVEQLTLEWHHMWWDPRFGEGSSPPINAIATLLHASGLKLFWQHSVGGWVSNVRAFQRLGMRDVRYNVASFMRPTTSTS